mmetsp:Transcript_3049/g.7151  ORF Transcript_3049/g.7151 Transcript_3049/m.7151 type:complete len:234 (-) Transcript_3049:196-897(-)
MGDLKTSPSLRPSAFTLSAVSRLALPGSSREFTGPSKRLQDTVSTWETAEQELEMVPNAYGSRPENARRLQNTEKKHEEPVRPGVFSQGACVSSKAREAEGNKFFIAAARNLEKRLQLSPDDRGVAEDFRRDVMEINVARRYFAPGECSGGRRRTYRPVSQPSEDEADVRTPPTPSPLPPSLCRFAASAQGGRDGVRGETARPREGIGGIGGIGGRGRLSREGLLEDSMRRRE